jgi:hypothetical protein
MKFRLENCALQEALGGVCLRTRSTAKFQEEKNCSERDLKARDKTERIQLF